MISVARSICADAREASAYSDLLGGERPALLLTDPPYCLLTRRRKGGDPRDPKGRKIDREPVVRFETVRDYRAFTRGWLPAAVASLAEGAPLVIWTNFLGREPILVEAAALGFGALWGEFVWAKRTTESRGSEQLLRVYETALVLGRAARRPLGPGDPPQAWSVVAGYDDDGEAHAWGDHPHHKPFGVLEPLVRAFSRPGELVLDPFGGSGSIAATAVKLARRAAVIELVPEWADRVAERLRRLVASQPP
jgi:site-specific DNA-methyltransferase (adenine-specific)